MRIRDKFGAMRGRCFRKEKGESLFREGVFCLDGVFLGFLGKVFVVMSGRSRFLEDWVLLREIFSSEIGFFIG